MYVVVNSEQEKAITYVALEQLRFCLDEFHNLSWNDL